MKHFLALLCLAGVTWVTRAESRALTLDEARRLAVAHSPRLSAANWRALAGEASVVAARAAYYPVITANATAVGTSQDNTRIAAGGLSNPGIYERNAEGLTISQLIADFGRTAHLTAGARLRHEAQLSAVEATQAQVVLLTETAYFDALRAGAVRQVADQTVATRTMVLDQVSVLVTNQVKSELDLSFARVALDEARILQLQSEGDLSAAFTRLGMLTGLGEHTEFQLTDVPPEPTAPPEAAELVRQALTQRPDLRQLDWEAQAAERTARAERATRYPTISAVGAVGVIPVHTPAFEDEYAAAGVNLSVPLFAGGLYSARSREAHDGAQAAAEVLKARQEEVVRDVRVARLEALTAAERVQASQRLAEHAAQAYELSEAKYRVGGASIVELSQAQLSRTLAAIEAASARYTYQIRLAQLRYQAGSTDARVARTAP